MTALDTLNQAAFIAPRVTATRDGCWEWQGPRTAAGYGTVNWRRPRPRQYAHRVSFELAVRPLAPGEEVCHRCDNPPCVNPAHLFAGSHAENMADMARKGRATTRPTPGMLHPAAKLTDAQVLEIRRRAATDEPQRAIAADYGIANTTVSMIHRRRIWRHL